MTGAGGLVRAGAPALILASGSRTRAFMLRNAGVEFEVEPAALDEAAVKQGLLAEGAPPHRIADTLAEMKAMRIARKRAGDRPGALVLGADQVLDLDGALLDKPADRAAAAEHLRRLSGKRHHLVSAAVLLKDGQRIWECSDRASLVVRPLSDRFIEAYLDSAGDGALDSVGAYRLEGPGAHLFASVDGDFFTILGLPLLPLLDFLRGHGVLET
ncbi:MAG: Maf family protein [Rhodospirillaceae bacterium]|nr:Maf family protein [Rhodospirillaceae bacterium]